MTTDKFDHIRRTTDCSALEAALKRAKEKLTTQSSLGLEAVSAASMVSLPEVVDDAILGGASLDRVDAEGATEQYSELEAIVELMLRPPHLIVGDEIEASTGGSSDPELAGNIDANKALLERSGTSVGLIDLFFHRRRPSAGTGWLLEPHAPSGLIVAVTNRHVAQIFVETNRFDAYSFREGVGVPLEARVNSRRQHQTAEASARQAKVVDVLWIAGENEPDIAFLLVEASSSIVPICFADRTVKANEQIAAIGYPADDPRDNNAAALKTYFDGIFDVKRFSPGYVTKVLGSHPEFHTDYTTLGGSSGSAVVSLDDGKVVGLHYGGIANRLNAAVPMSAVYAALRTQVTVVPVDAAIPSEAVSTPAAEFAGRKGYEAGFLGDGAAVPLPKLCDHEADRAPVSDDADGVLKYQNFSVIQSASRRLPRVTAVNIDGAKTRRLKRHGRWRRDARLRDEHQIGNEVYRDNPLDRGHMVRRRDPGWGATDEIAARGEADTFHYTNAVPQHEDLNQRDWVGLEDYVLEATETEGFRASVFTGPVLRNDDPLMKRPPGSDPFRLPEEFWKVVAIRRVDTGKLSATGYILSHGRMIRNLTEAAFVFGAYKTYQVSIAKIEAETGLDFGALKDADPMAVGIQSEAFGAAARPISGPGDLMLA